MRRWIKISHNEEVGRLLKIIINRMKEMSSIEKLKDIVITNQDTKELLEKSKEIVIAEQSIIKGEIKIVE